MGRRIIDQQQSPAWDRPEAVGLGKQFGTTTAKQRTPREPFARSENSCQKLLGCRRGIPLIEPPANDVIKLCGRLPREIPEAAQMASLALRAIVARTRSATSSPLR